jgi:hypothetical protein
VRLFPKDKSMMPDEVGNKDYMAIVVSKNPLDWFALNQKIDQNRNVYSDAVRAAVSGAGTAGRMKVEGSNKGNIRFTAPSGENGLAWAVVEINK